MFLTGSAGTGKSFLLGHIVKRLRGIHKHDAVAVTASTGSSFHVQYFVGHKRTSDHW